MTAELTEYTRLSYLGDKVKSGNATKEEKDEFMEYMYTHGNIDEEQYFSFKNGINADKIVNAALSVGAVVLIAFLLDELFSRK